MVWLLAPTTSLTPSAAYQAMPPRHVFSGMHYRLLVRNQWTCFWRSLRGRKLWLTWLVIAPGVLYVILVLVALGILYGHLFSPSYHPLGAVAHLNGRLLTLLLGLFTTRFFFQRPPRMAIQPYLHLPIDHSTLVRYFQASSLLSVHNVYPFLFLVPFYVRYVHGTAHAPWGGWYWLAALVLSVLLTHFANTIARIVMDRYSRLFALLAVALIGVQIVDQTWHTNIVASASAAFFNPLLVGRLWPLFILLGLTVASGVIAGRALHSSLKKDVGSVASAQQRLLPVMLEFGDGTLRNLVLLELKMMWRNKRAKQYVVIAVIVSTLYTALLISDFNPLGGVWMYGIIGLFASGVFALNYGQLMFAWESRHFDGLLARTISTQQMVMAKLMLLVLSCLFLFLISLPLFIWLAPSLIPLHVAFLYYNAGVTSLLMMVLAVRNERRLNASRGSFFAYEGFSMLHWIWIIPTIIPPTIVLLLFDDSPERAFSMIALVGLLSMLLLWPWSLALARYLNHRRYRMAAGFRTYEY